MFKRIGTRAALLGLLVVTVFSASSCDLGDVIGALVTLLFVPYSTPTHDILPGVTFFDDAGYGSAAATIKMWWQFYSGSSGSQADIWSYLSGQGATSGNAAGVSQSVFAGALVNYTGVGLWHNYSGTCGTKPCAQQAAGDITAAIENSRPPAVIWQGYYAMFIGYDSLLDCSVIDGCYTDHTYFQLDIPASGYGQVLYTTGYVGSILSSGADVFFANSVDPGRVQGSDWDSWDYFHGTYYGDPDPLGPMCADFMAYCQGSGNGGGPPPNAPIIGGGNGQQSQSLFQRINGVAVLNPQTRQDIIADFVAALRKTTMDSVAGLSGLTTDDGNLEVKEILQVRSFVPLVDDYYLIFFGGKGDDTIMGRAALSSQGLLLSVGLGEAAGRPLLSAADAIKLAAAQGFGELQNLTLGFALGPGTSLELDPSYVGTDSRGHRILVTSKFVVRDLDGATPLPVGLSPR